jgi:hypothetical protein
MCWVCGWVLVYLSIRNGPIFFTHPSNTGSSSGLNQPAQWPDRALLYLIFWTKKSSRSHILWWPHAASVMFVHSSRRPTIRRKPMPRMRFQFSYRDRKAYSIAISSITRSLVAVTTLVWEIGIQKTRVDDWVHAWTGSMSVSHLRFRASPWTFARSWLGAMDSVWTRENQKGWLDVREELHVGYWQANQYSATPGRNQSSDHSPHRAPGLSIPYAHASRRSS